MNPADCDNPNDARAFGIARWRAARERGAMHRFPWASDAQGEFMDGESAIAEWQAARMLGRKWISGGIVRDDPDAGDISGSIGMRLRTYGPRSYLPVKPEDRDHIRMILAIGDHYPFTLVGWIRCGEARRPEWWWPKLPKPAWMVHPKYLRDWQELIQEH